MSNTEIEDVLSSIRRLVTEDHRPLQRPDAPPADKLVLTPALRIEPAQSAVRQSFGAAEPLRLVAAQSPDPAVTPSHQAAAAVESALKGHRDDWEPDGTESAASTRWSVEWDTTDADETAGAGSAPPLAVRATATEIPSPPVAWGTAPAEGNAAEDDIWDEFLAEHRSAPLLAAEQAAPWRPAQSRGAERPAEMPRATEPAEDRHEEPDVDIDRTAAAERGPQTAQPVSGAAADGAGHSPWDAGQPADRSDMRLDDGLSGAAAAQLPPGIDEALLRDLIRDILREELQGELGERITRNVGKLVRAELARALTARDPS